jgi:hypothetical protein
MNSFARIKNARFQTARAISSILAEGYCSKIAAVILLLMCTAAHAADGHRFSGIVLSKFCNSAHGGGYDDGICAGYITGIADAMMREPGMDKKLCMPRNLSTSDFSRLVTRHLARNPDDATAPAADIARTALLRAFPCS